MARSALESKDSFKLLFCASKPVTKVYFIYLILSAAFS